MDQPVSSALYIEMMLAWMRDDHEGSRAFKRHAHWGYWPNPSKASITVEGYADAAEQMSLEMMGAAAPAAGQFLLDAGCGFGGTLATLNENNRGLRMTGINIDERQLRKCPSIVLASGDNTIDFVLGDAGVLPFESGRFDRVMAVECIFHFNRKLFFHEASRVLKPGGRLVISDFVRTKFGKLAMMRRDPEFRKKMERVWGKVDTEFTMPQYRELARESNLVLESTRNITRNTLPTYKFLRGLMKSWPERSDAALFNTAVWVLDIASRLNMIQYLILSFRKPAA